MLKNFHVILALFAGSIIGIVSIILNDPLKELMYKVIPTIIVFYIIGIIIKKIIYNAMVDENKNSDDRLEETSEKDTE